MVAQWLQNLRSFDLRELDLGSAGGLVAKAQSSRGVGVDGADAGVGVCTAA